MDDRKRSLFDSIIDDTEILGGYGFGTVRDEFTLYAISPPRVPYTLFFNRSDRVESWHSVELPPQFHDDPSISFYVGPKMLKDNSGRLQAVVNKAVSHINDVYNTRYKVDEVYNQFKALKEFVYHASFADMLDSVQHSLNCAHLNSAKTNSTLIIDSSTLLSPYIPRILPSVNPSKTNYTYDKNSLKRDLPLYQLILPDDFERISYWLSIKSLSLSKRVRSSALFTKNEKKEQEIAKTSVTKSHLHDEAALAWPPQYDIDLNTYYYGLPSINALNTKTLRQIRRNY